MKNISIPRLTLSILNFVLLMTLSGYCSDGFAEVQSAGSQSLESQRKDSASIDSVKQVTVNSYLQAAEAKGLKVNNLIDESSPYLLQHAYNPVNWYAWGDEAFEKAKKENKPIFLSIGYSTCHWCHVMAHESFENKKIAALLNKYFVAIKVDREQRPDIDVVYMAATQLISGHGGWPMTVFLDNQLRPFHAATYYPPFSADGRLGLQDVLLKIHELWTEQPDEVDDVATAVTARIEQMADDTIEGGILDSDINQLAMKQIAGRFDDEMGGFSAAPKFPRPGIFAFLNRVAERSNIIPVLNSDVTSGNKVSADDARKMMQITLDAMADGGIYDQVAGGFHRYSVDDNWQVPHFEKMLYSQALMVMAYNDFYRADGSDKSERQKYSQQRYKQQQYKRERYKDIIYQTLGFVKHEMRSPQGGYYSALDADSERFDEKGHNTGEHAEGAYYLWSESELKKLLTKDEFNFIKQYFHIRENGNIFSDPQQEFADLNIFYIDEEYRNMVLSKQQQNWLNAAKKKLNKQRHRRPRPHLDDKVITAWNGMLLSAFAQASITFDDKVLLADAVDILDYTKKYLYDDNSKKLFRSHREMSKTNPVADDRVEAILADYVWLIDGLLNVYQAGEQLVGEGLVGEGQAGEKPTSENEQWLQWATALQEKQDVLFLDPASGAYFEASNSDKNLLFRSKSIFDGAIPSANAIALSNLRKFSELSKKSVVKEQAAKKPATKKQITKKSYAKQAEMLVSSFAIVVNQNPSAAAMLLAIEITPVVKSEAETEPEPEKFPSL